MASKKESNGLENVPALQMVAAVTPGTNQHHQVTNGRQVPSHSLDFFGSFLSRKKEQKIGLIK